MRTEEVTDVLKDVTERVIWPRWRALAAHEVDEKRPGDLVTIADREAEEELTRALASADPGAVVIGEEAAFADPRALAALPTADHAWVIDPVDGTRNFAAGREDFGVILAEVRRGETVRGWIWQPAHRALYVVERGGGVTRNGEALPRLAARTPPWRAAVPRRLRTENPSFRFSWTRGACAVDYPRLAEGDVDALAWSSQHPWDHLAGVLLVTELGGSARRQGSERPWQPGPEPGAGRHLLVTADAAIMAALQEHAGRL